MVKKKWLIPITKDLDEITETLTRVFHRNIKRVNLRLWFPIFFIGLGSGMRQLESYFMRLRRKIAGEGRFGLTIHSFRQGIFLVFLGIGFLLFSLSLTISPR